jgi:CheY-like chemotaxis protein
MAFNILVVDDEVNSCIMISDFLQDSGYSVKTANDASSAIELLQKETFNLVVADKNMPGLDDLTNEGGMQLLRYVQNNLPALQVIIMTGFATLDTAIEALRLGAFDYITKPFSVKDLLMIVERLESFKSYLNPENVLLTYRELQKEIIECIDAGRNNIPNGKDLIHSIEEKIEGFIRKQKDWEKILIEQREALTQVETYALELQSILGETPEAIEIVNKIINAASNRL